MSKLRAIKRQARKNAGPQVHLSPLFAEALHHYKVTHTVDLSNSLWVFAALHEIGLLALGSTPEHWQLVPNWQQRCRVYLKKLKRPGRT